MLQVSVHDADRIPAGRRKSGCHSCAEPSLFIGRSLDEPPTAIGGANSAEERPGFSVVAIVDDDHFVVVPVERFGQLVVQSTDVAGFVPGWDHDRQLACALATDQRGCVANGERQRRGVCYLQNGLHILISPSFP
jgi:hypothetical protein